MPASRTSLRSPITLVLPFLLVSLLAFFGAVAHAATPASEQMDAGVAAYRQGDLDTALRHFQAVRQAGIDTPRLRFNLALTHYRLRRYARAETLFHSLRGTPDYDGMATYHLGLIAERRGERRAARDYYQQLRAETGAEKLRLLAEAGLQRLHVARTTDLYLFAGGGYDSNPALLADPDRFDSDGDVVLESFGQITHRRGAKRFEAGYFLRRHADASAFDTTLVHAALGRERGLGGGLLHYRGDVTAVRIDGERLQEAYTLKVDWQRPVGSHRRLDLHLQSARIVAARSFDYLTGWRYRLGLRLTQSWQRSWLMADYRFTHDDRRDRAQNDTFFSQSPQHHSVLVELGRRLGEGVFLVGNAEYRRSRFADADRFLDEDGAVMRRRRVEDRYTLGLGARWHFHPQWRVLVDATHTRNQASINGFEYDRNALMFGLEWSR